MPKITLGQLSFMPTFAEKNETKEEIEVIQTIEKSHTVQKKKEDTENIS